MPVVIITAASIPAGPIDITGWNSVHAEIQTTGQAGTPVDIWFNEAGRNVYICDDSADAVHQWSMSPGFNFSSLTFVSTWAMPAAINRPFGMVLTPNEDFVIIADITDHVVESRAILTPADITTTEDAVTDSVTTVGVTATSDINGMYWADEGRKLYFTDNSGAGYWPVSTPYDFGTIGAHVYVNFVTAAIDATGGGSDIQVDDGGFRMWLLRTSNPWEIKQYDLGTQWEPSTAVLTSPPTFTSLGGGVGNQGFVIRLEEGEIYTHSTSSGDDWYLHTKFGDPQPNVYDDLVLALSPVAYYKMDETIGSVMVDSSGNARDGTHQTVTLGSTAVANDGGNSVAYSGGAASYSDIDPGVLDMANFMSEKSIECWVNTVDTVGPIIVGGGPTGTPIIGMYLGNNGVTAVDGQLLCIVRGNTGPLHNSGTTVLINDGNDHHIVWTMAPGAGGFNIYVDGSNVHSSTSTLANGITTNDPEIGRDAISTGGSPHFSFLGLVDNVAIYDVELTSQQVTDHYQAGI